MKKTGKKSGRPKNSTTPRSFQAALLCGLVIFVFYLIGRVQIDVVMREKIKLEHESKQLSIRIKSLEVEVDRLCSLGNLKGLMAERGLQEVSPSMQSRLEVDLHNIQSEMENFIRRDEQTVNYAGFRLPGKR